MKQISFKDITLGLCYTGTLKYIDLLPTSIYNNIENMHCNIYTILWPFLVIEEAVHQKVL